MTINERHCTNGDQDNAFRDRCITGDITLDIAMEFLRKPNRKAFRLGMVNCSVVNQSLKERLLIQCKLEGLI